MDQPSISEDLLSLDSYATKAMAEKVRSLPGAINLAFGEPHFGPPAWHQKVIETNDLTWDTFLETGKRYEKSRGMPELRAAIADYYARLYGFTVDPETEILITHGGVEAIALSILVTSQQCEPIAVTDPSYMLYQRAIKGLGRKLAILTRKAGEHEYQQLFSGVDIWPEGANALIVNSPENPSGYMLSEEDIQALADTAVRQNAWIIHDEVYDSMAFGRAHKPLATFDGLRDRTLMINSFSKKYGMPGLRIGWLCGPAAAIEQAAKLHDFLYLGVNALSERFALRMISDVSADPWMRETSDMLGKRATILKQHLTEEKGFHWYRSPMGAMFAFPEVSALVPRLPENYQALDVDTAHKVSTYLLEQHGLATIPGSVYGPSGENFIRMILCSDDDTFERGIDTLSKL